MFRSRGARRLAPVVSGALVAGLLVLVAPSASAIDSPGGLSVAEGSARILSWDRVPGATGYEVQVARTAAFSPTVVSVTTVNDEYVPSVELPAGELWWRVRAKAGATVGEWTPSSFTTTTSAAPVPVRPLQDATFQAPTTPLFTWEPVPGATSYTVQTSPDPSFVDPTLIASNKQDTTAAYLVEYPVVGDYYWRVQAELTSGYSTAWSEPLRYHVRGLPPATLQGPVDSFVPEVTDVVLDWAPVTGAATYDLQVSTDENFLSATLVRDIVGTRWSPEVTLNNDEYYWRVRPVDTSGNAAPWPAEPWRFRRAWSAQPTATYPRGVVDTSRPFFYQWEPIARADQYTVILFDETGDIVCSATTIHTTMAGDCVPAQSGSYRWRVVGIDNTKRVVTDQLAQTPASFDYTVPSPVTPAPAGSLSVSDVTGHRVSLTGTAAFSGADGDTCEGVLPATCLDLRQTPVLTWDPVPGATSYRVTLSYDRELTNRVPEHSEMVVKEPMWTPSKTLTLKDSQAGSAYFWVVQPCGTTCAPIEYPTHSFAKKTVGPELASPADGEVVANDVTLTWGSELAAVRRPEAAAGSALTTPGTMEAKSYVVQTALDPGFATGVESRPVDQTTLTSVLSTYAEGIVYWRVRALDGGGNTTVWSAARSFVKRSPVPELLTPADGAALGQDYTLAWEPLDFAASYDVEVYAGPTRVATANTVHSSWAPSTPFPASVDGYTWRVRRVDADGRKGDWSQTRTFWFAGFPPSQASPAPSAVMPPSGGRFTWVSDARATSYRFERRKPGSTDLAESVVTRATAWSPTATLAAGTAQWRVVALDTESKPLGSSPWRDFVVVDPPAVVTDVSITGSGAIGTELRAYAPTFDPAAQTTTYQWYRATSPISGATGETYTVVAADVGRAITVRATGAVPGYQAATSTSNAITAVSGPPLTVVTPVSISGSGVVGTELQASAPTFDPAASTTSYQWLRNGSSISGATGATYTVVSSDVGKAITVRATGSGVPGYQDTPSTSDPVNAVSTPPLKVVAAVAITGTGAVGTELRATAPTFDPAAAAVAYQWYRGTSSITGATGETYLVAPSDVGKSITVRATGSAAGHQNATSTSAAVTGVTGDAPVAERAPSVGGTAAVGSRLTVVPGAWAGSPRLTYQWFRDGVPISRATSTSYTPTAADAAHRLTVVETATLTGRTPGTATSPAVTVAKIASAVALTLSSTSTTTRKRAVVTVTVTASGLVAPGGSISVYVGRKRVKVVSLGTRTSVKVRLPKQRPGAKTVRAVYSGGAQALGSSGKVRLKVTRR